MPTGLLEYDWVLPVNSNNCFKYSIEKYRVWNSMPTGLLEYDQVVKGKMVN